jgi:hypothetical protein
MAEVPCEVDRRHRASLGSGTPGNRGISPVLGDRPASGVIASFAATNRGWSRPSPMCSGNASRYTDSEGRIYVAASRIKLGDHWVVRISVRDTGRGIDPALLQSIFGMFVQGGTRSIVRCRTRRWSGAREIHRRASSRDDNGAERGARQRSRVCHQPARAGYRTRPCRRRDAAFATAATKCGAAAQSAHPRGGRQH